MSASSGPKYLRNSQAAARIIAGRAFVITPMDHKLHTLNETATVLWGLAADGCTIEQAAQELVFTYEVEKEQAISDTITCFADLVERSVMVIES